MIIKNLKLKHSSSVAKLSLGRQGEHGATCVEIDVGDFRDKFGAGRAELLFCPPYGSESFPVPMDLEDDLYKWEIGESVTHKAGIGLATLRWYVGDDLAKSCSIECYVQSSADGKIGEMPDVIKDWLDHLMENLPSGDGSASPSDLRKAIEKYFAENPIESMSEDDVRAIIESYGYLLEHQSLADYYTKDEINEIESTRVQNIVASLSQKADADSVYTKEEADAKTWEFGQNALSEVAAMLSGYATKDEIPEPFDDSAMRTEMVSLENAYREANSNVMQLYNTVVADKKDKIIGTYGSSISNRVYEVIGIPEYIGEDELGTVNGFNITTTGWYAFARITADNGVYVGSSLIVDGVEDYKAGVNYIDVAVRFGTNGESRAITVNWNGSVTNTYLISASDLAIRNLDYRSTYRVYDIGDCLSFTTSGTKKAVFQNLTRNIVYAVDAIDCPMVVHLPEVSTESFGTWIEMRVELTTSTNVSLEFIPPGSTKLSGTNVNVPKEGLNIIMAQYHEKMNTWFISNTVWAKPK